jgi:transposase-like protein
MYADGFSSHKVLDSDKKTVLYRTLRNPRGGNKPHVEVYRPGPNARKDIFVGSVTENQGSFGSKFDVELGYHQGGQSHRLE